MNIIKSLDHVSQILHSYLVDNTEEVFEEIGEVDEARSIIEEVKEALEDARKKWHSLKSEITSMENPLPEKDKSFSGFSVYEVDNDGELSVEWPNLKITFNQFEQALMKDVIED